MTAKILSWATFGLIALGALPIVANPTFTASSTSEFLQSRINVRPLETLPPCGTCYLEKSQEFDVLYAVDRNSICTPERPYRTMAHLSTKVPCDSGGYWICEDVSALKCSTYVERPVCPQDTCVKGG
jgi:hypothetical protein